MGESLSEFDDDDENLLREALNVHLYAASAVSGYILRKMRFQSLLNSEDQIIIKMTLAKLEDRLIMFRCNIHFKLL